MRHVYQSAKREAVELISGEYGFTTVAAQLPLLHHMHGLNASDQFLGAPE